ncbi:hypothetical protein EAF04_005620 [Stromatinia cepivora]|nr:hypothetical protein EAF04_005620 [Stromatinia cepivora]
MGNKSSHQPIPSSTPTSQTSSSNSSTKSSEHFHIHSNPFSHHFHSDDRRTPSIDEHGALLEDDKDIGGGDDGTYLLRRGSLESREEWLARKQIIASRIKGNSESDGGVKMWKNCTFDGGQGRL